MTTKYLSLAIVFSVDEIRDIPHELRRKLEVILLWSRDRYIFDPASILADDGDDVLEPSETGHCVCCEDSGRWLKKDATAGPPGADGADAFVSAEESKDETSGTVSTATAYPSWSSAILSHNVTVEVGDKVLADFTATATWAPGDDTTGIVVGISISGCPPQAVGYFDTSGLGYALRPGMAGGCIFPIGPGEEVTAAGTYAVTLHIARNGTNAMLAAEAMRPIRLRTLVVRP